LALNHNQQLIVLTVRLILSIGILDIKNTPQPTST